MQKLKLEIRRSKNNAKYVLEKDGWKWDDIREAVIKYYNNQCQASGIYTDKYMFVHFTDLNYFLRLTDSLNNNRKELLSGIDFSKCAVCVCEAAHYMMNGFACYDQDWMRPNVEFRYSTTWTQNQVLDATFKGAVGKDFFNKYLYRFGLMDTVDTFDSKFIVSEDRFEELQVVTSSFIGDSLHIPNGYRLVAWRILEDMRAEIIPFLDSEHIWRGLVIILSPKYKFNLRNKESLSLKIRNKNKSYNYANFNNSSNNSHGNNDIAEIDVDLH